MKSSRLTSCLVVFSLSALHLSAQESVIFKPDGQPDPAYDVPSGLNLRYALAFALDNNFAIRQAKERIRQQEGVVLEVKSSQIPNVAASGAYSRNADEVSTNGYDYSWSFGVTARQVLYSGGGVTASVRAQNAVREAAVLALQSVINDALLDVRTRFYTVIVNRERIKVQEQNIQLLQRQLQDVKNRYEAGTVSNFEVLRAEVALANAQPALIRARNEFRNAIEDLRQSLGFVTATEPNVAKLPDFIGELEFHPAEFDLRSSLATAREKRPDLLRLKQLETAAEEGVTARRANYYPDVSAFGSYDFRKAPFGSTTGSTRDGWTVGLQSTWDIFDGRATAGRVAQARSLLEQARLALGDAQLAIDVEVRRAISSLQEADELAAASKKVVEQAEESLRLANARFGAGSATQLDVLTAQTDLTTARLNQIQAFYSHTIAVARVRKALGLPDELAAQ